jgi:high-affinity iron transporter
MLPAFLITLREVIEASLIVATILGILIKLKQSKGVKTVWVATAAATGASVLLLAAGSLLGFKMQEIYSGKTEEFIEGILMITSAIFITWAVFFLHKYFAHHKVKLLQKIRTAMEKEEEKGLFILVFTAVFREGFEVVLFLSTIYFSTDPQSIFTGFLGGAAAGLFISFLLFTATLKMPIFYAFRATSILLILFAAGLLARGIHEFAEVGLVPEVSKITLGFIPHSSTVVGDIIKAVFGITQHMDIIPLTFYALYIAFMSWFVFYRKKAQA